MKHKLTCQFISHILSCILALLPAAAGLACVLAGNPLSADEYKPFLHTLFSSHMVFPRDVQAPIWGWTVPGAKVTVAMQDKTAETTAGADGKWMLKLGPFPTGGPYKLTVSGPQNSVTLDDVLVGDVWLCTGQSNMTMGITAVDNAQKEIAQANHPKLRLFDQPPWLKEGQSCHWSLCTPQEIVNQSFVTGKGPDGKYQRVGFSAAAYFFGRDLLQELAVPIGLVQTSAPGTFIEMWSSRAVLEPVVGEEDKEIEAWFRRNDPGTPGLAAPAFDDSAWQTATFPLGKDKPQFSGILWLRKSFELPPDWAGKDLSMTLGWLSGLPGVWMNGEFLGNLTPDGSCTLPAKLMKAGRNTVAVRILNPQGHFGFDTPKAEDMRLEPAHEKGAFSLAGPWRYQTQRAAGELEAQRPVVRVRHVDAACDGGSLFKNLISPMAPFAFKGVVWYQGEANQGERARVYHRLLTGMIADWRNRFPTGSLPFLIVQLANCNHGNQPTAWSLPLLREAQAEVARTVPNVAMAVAADIGEEQNEHPKNKQEVGRRLALKALEKVYGKKIDSSGPVFKGMEESGGALRLTFDHIGGGLTAKDGELKGFYVAGADGQFVSAKAVIEGRNVIVSSPENPKPVHVRYGWGNWTPCDLYNKEGLPAEPFRTDTLPVK